MTKLQILGIIIAATCLATTLLKTIIIFYCPEAILSMLQKMTASQVMRNSAASFIKNLLIVGGILLILLGGR